MRLFLRRHVSDRAVEQEALTDEQRWRRHQIRQIAVLITLPAILIGTGGIAAAWSVGLMHHSSAPQCVPVVVDAPARDAFQIRVLNGSGVSGAAAHVSKALGKRGFVVVEASTAPTDIYVRGPAKIFHGPDSLDPALLLAQQIDGAELTDDGRMGVVLTMVLGGGYADLVPPPTPSRRSRPRSRSMSGTPRGMRVWPPVRVPTWPREALSSSAPAMTPRMASCPTTWR